MFKGGTSLSKAWNIISRFSEDVDIALDRTYSTGDTLNLVINNLTEEVSSCIWYINGTRAITDSFVVKHSGTYDIKATLRYVSDGSEENIERTITVKDSSTSDET